MSAQTVAAVVFVAFTALIYYLGLGLVRARERGVDRLLAMQSREEFLRVGFAERAVAPIVQSIGSFVMRFTPQGWARRTTRRLVHAGWQDAVDANSWAAIRLLAVGSGLIVAMLIPGDRSTLLDILWLIVFGLIGWLAPDAALNRRIEERADEMRRQLPEIMDLLVISVEAGLSFDGALRRVVQTVPGSMSEEFSRMLSETRVGVSRREAMRHLSERTDVDELDSFLLAMMQADSFGVSVSRVLRVQAEEMRVKRRQRAQERAFGAPVKMVFPLILCIFPAMFIVILGPAVIEISGLFD